MNLKEVGLAAAAARPDTELLYYRGLNNYLYYLGGSLLYVIVV